MSQRPTDPRNTKQIYNIFLFSQQKLFRELVKKEKELKKDSTKASDEKKKERLEKADSAFKRIASESKGNN